MTEEDWISLHVAANTGEAELMAGLLRAEGISVLVRGAGFLMEGQQVFPEIVVPRSMAARARELLDGASKAEPSGPPHEDRTRERGGRMLAFVGGTALGAFGVLLVVTQGRPIATEPRDRVVSRDRDGDGRPDESIHYRHGQVVERRWSFRGDGVVDKKVFYRHGSKTEEHLDVDRDGVFEVKKEFDTFEREKPRPAPSEGSP